MSITIGDIVQSLQSQSGVLIILLIIFGLGYHGIWVWGRELLREQRAHKETHDELVETRRMLFETLTTSHAGVALARRAVNAVVHETIAEPEAAE